MILVTKRKYEKDLNDAYAEINKINEEKNKIEKDYKNLNTIWIKEKTELTEKIKGNEKDIDELNVTCQNLEILNHQKDSIITDLKKEIFDLSSSKGGLKSTISRQKNKIDKLEDELRKSNPAFYKVHKLKDQKVPKMNHPTILKNQKNGQVKAQLKSLGDK